mmetsp:Transcript_6346/g.5569  ORF Transcript_6346/g.5569 Transcript_6346/m.5569 type:complete len:146 (+) Transcript_6346:570-1007(+)
MTKNLCVCAINNNGQLGCWDINHKSKGLFLEDVDMHDISIRFDPINRIVEVYRLKTSGVIVDTENIPARFHSDVFLIDAGSFHACALRQDVLAQPGGELGCWGKNDFGQTSAPSGCAATVLQVSLGSMHTCAMSWRILTCWGSNQ